MNLICVLLVAFALLVPLVPVAATEADDTDGLARREEHPALKPSYDDMAPAERRATRLAALEEMIRRATDESIDRDHVASGGDRWISPRQFIAGDLAYAYNGRCMSSPLYPPTHRFESKEEQDQHRSMIVACLLGLLEDKEHPGVRTAAALSLSRLSVDELKEAERAEILQGLRRAAADDPSPVVRVQAAEAVLTLDPEAIPDESIRATLQAIALDEGDLGWILENTDFGRYDLRRREASVEEVLLAAKDRARMRAFELLSMMVDEVSREDLEPLLRAAEGLVRNVHLEPGTSGMKLRPNAEEIQDAKRQMFVDRLGIFISSAQSALDERQDASRRAE